MKLRVVVGAITVNPVNGQADCVSQLLSPGPRALSKPSLDDSKIAILIDFETTGLNTLVDEVIEIGNGQVFLFRSGRGNCGY